MIFRMSISCFLCWCWCIILTAQTFKIDSLEQALNSFKGSDYEKGLLLIQISKEARDTDTTKSRLYALEALHLAQKTELKIIEEIAYHTLGNHYLTVDQYYLSHVYYKKAEKLALQLNNKVLLCNVYHNLMILFSLINDESNVVYYADKLLETVGNHYDLTTLTPSKSLENADEPNLVIYVFAAQLYKGEVLVKDKKIQEVMDFYSDMYQKSISLEVGNPNYIALQIGKALNKHNRHWEALQYLHQIRKNFETSAENWSIKFSTYINIAEALAILHQTDSAEYYLEKAWESAPVKYDDIRYLHYRVRSVIDENKGEYLSALSNFKIYHHLFDSTAIAGKSEMALMKNWQEMEQKDKENIILHKGYQKQHKLVLVLAIAMVMILALFAPSVFYYRKTAQKNRELKKLHTVKDKLFSVVAHDLRSPMSALMSVLKLADRDMLDAETQAQLFKDISMRVDDTYGLIDNLLRWSKSQMQGIIPLPAYFDVLETSRVVTDSLQNVAAGKKIILYNHIDPLLVYADRDMFTVVVRNLTTNAIKYTSEGGKVILASALSGNMLAISVKDTGTGMSPEVQDNLFKLSETQSRRGTNNESGIGLGLVLCADLVKINGGNIWFTSKQNEGSTFFFSIPIRKD